MSTDRSSLYGGFMSGEGVPVRDRQRSLWTETCQTKTPLLTETAPEQKAPGGTWDQAARQEVTLYRDLFPRWRDWLTVLASNFVAGGKKSSLLPPANEVWGKVIFSEACVKNSVHRGVGLSACTWHTPQGRACWEIRSTSGRYASYWSAILLNFNKNLFLWYQDWPGFHLWWRSSQSVWRNSQIFWSYVSTGDALIF